MLKRYLSHPLQGLASYVFFALIKLLPISWASSLGGWIGREIGPGLGISRRARRNLAIAFPEKSSEEIERLVLEMWDNLGRTVMEYPLLGRIKVKGANPHVEVIGAENIDLIRDDDKAGIFFSGHIANWEIPAICISENG
ncbi:MAG: lauroyl acyltransferase, partial [Rhodospirillales bacterium]|nr:lauroyl acyltransferase [Rhodospirillales bacterium]